MQEYRVLIVEDDLSWQENFKETVASIGYLTQVTGSVEEAEYTLDRQHFHLVVVDLRLNGEMQELEGMKLVKKVAQLGEGTSTIVVSGYADATIATEALKTYNAFYVIEKAKIDPKRFIELAQDAVSQAEEQYRTRFPSAMDFLRGAQDTHSWAAETLQTIWGKERTLGLRDLNQLRDLLNALLANLFPLLFHHLDQGMIINRDTGVVSARCWSKALGEPILVKFGRRELVDQEIENTEPSSDVLAQSGFVRLERVQMVGELGGVVYVAADAPFADFAIGDI